MDYPGNLFVVAAPSGAGKSSLVKALLEIDSRVQPAVSHTTRPPRGQEKHGREYFFLSSDEFDGMVDRNAFLEWAHVHEHRYGTPKDEVMGRIEAGRDVLFDIDWQGARQIAGNALDDVVRVFILPPSMAEMSRRLHARAQDREDVIQRRLGRAYGEIPHWNEYDYVLVNEDIEATYVQLAAIYRAERLRRDRVLGLAPFVERLLDERLG